MELTRGPAVIDADYVLSHIHRFWAARYMVRLMETRFQPPAVDPSLGMLSDTSVPSGCWQQLHAAYGIYQHGTRVECINSILLKAFGTSVRMLSIIVCGVAVLEMHEKVCTCTEWTTAHALAIGIPNIRTCPAMAWVGHSLFTL